MRRILGVDHGDRRSGLALSDPLGILSSPLCEIRAGGPEAMVKQVVDAALEHDVERVVVGLPRNMDGSEGPRARAVRDFAEALQTALGTLPVELVDERLTTYEATQLINKKKVTGGDRKKELNLLAARIILQTYLDSRKP